MSAGRPVVACCRAWPGAKRRLRAVLYVTLATCVPTPAGAQTVASASPATGSYTIHQLEQQQLVKEALGF